MLGGVTIGLRILHAANPALVTQENREALIASRENARPVANGLESLLAAGLLTQDNFNLLFDRNEKREIKPILLTEPNFTDLFRMPDEPILYDQQDGDIRPLPPRELPAPLTRKSFKHFVQRFMNAKYDPFGQAARAAKKRFERFESNLICSLLQISGFFSAEELDKF